MLCTVNLPRRHCTAQLFIVDFNLSWILGAQGWAVEWGFGIKKQICQPSMVCTVKLLLRYCPAQVIIGSCNLSWIWGARGERWGYGDVVWYNTTNMPTQHNQHGKTATQILYCHNGCPGRGASLWVANMMVNPS